VTTSLVSSELQTPIASSCIRRWFWLQLHPGARSLKHTRYEPIAPSPGADGVRVGDWRHMMPLRLVSISLLQCSRSPPTCSSSAAFWNFGVVRFFLEVQSTLRFYYILTANAHSGGVGCTGHRGTPPSGRGCASKLSLNFKFVRIYACSASVCAMTRRLGSHAADCPFVARSPVLAA
jgi:hypothetical protein